MIMNNKLTEEIKNRLLSTKNSLEFGIIIFDNRIAYDDWKNNELLITHYEELKSKGLSLINGSPYLRKRKQNN